MITKKCCDGNGALPHYCFTHGTKPCARATAQAGMIVAVESNTRSSDELRLLQRDQTNLETGRLDVWPGYIEHAVDDYVWSHASCYGRSSEILFW